MQFINIMNHSVQYEITNPNILLVNLMFTAVLPTISCFGFVTNLINILIFSNFQLKENIFTYLLAHSISNAFYTFITFFCWISRSGSLFFLSNTYFSKFYEIYIFHVGIYGFGTLTALIDIAISLDRLFLVKKLNSLKKESL